LFKPAVEFGKLSSKQQRSVLWLEKNHHGIKYSNGNYELHEISNIMQKHPADVVIVKGEQKREYLKNYYRNIFNAEKASDCVKFQKQWIFGCSNHSLTYAFCSKENVVDLYKCTKEINVF
jgi:hypothetical protein